MPYFPFRPSGRRGRSYVVGGVPAIDDNNRLARGLAFCWVTLGGYQLDLVSGVFGTYTTKRPGQYSVGQSNWQNANKDGIRPQQAAIGLLMGKMPIRMEPDPLMVF
jgi:hypothetical protein